MRNKKLTYFLLVGFALLLSLSIYNGYVQKKYNYWGITSNAVFMVSMLLIVYTNRKKQ